MACGGFKQGISYGEADEMGYAGVKDRVHITTCRLLYFIRWGWIMRGLLSTIRVGIFA